MSARLAVRVHPGARRAGLVGFLADGTLKLEVPEPPAGGRANRAVEALLADALGIARGRVTVVRGQGSRTKTVGIEGLDGDEVRRRLARAGAASGETHGE